MAALRFFYVRVLNRHGFRQDLPYTPLPQDNGLVLRVTPKAMVGSQEKTQETLGSARGCDGGPCIVAGVQYDRVLSLSVARRLRCPPSAQTLCLTGKSIGWHQSQ